MTEHILKDDWLSYILKRDVYKVVLDDPFFKELKNTTGTEYDVFQSLKNSYIFMFSRVSPQKIDYTQCLEKEGFFLVDTNVAFEKYTSTHEDAEPNLCQLYFAESKDEEETVSLAKKAFSYSRFHLDPTFPRETANYVRGEWVRNYFNGQRGDELIVARMNENVTGFLQLIYRSDGVLVIDLIAVDEAYRRKGIAGAMIRFAEKSCGDFRTVRVGTQIANSPSLKLYESLGFRVTSADYIFHYHNRP